VFPQDARRGGLSSPAVITFKPTVFEHMYDPWERLREIDTPQELLRECEARGVQSQYLRDSLLWPHRAPREI
jgi:hypothetical protein